MSPAAKRALEELAADDPEADEIVCDGLECWLGDRRISRGTLNHLLRLLALRDVSDTKGLERYAINETGRALLLRPDLEQELVAAVAAGKPFTMNAGHLEIAEPVTPATTPPEAGSSATTATKRLGDRK